MLSQIVAHSTNHVIGKDNTLPWDYPEDLKHFKNITTGKTILMGRKTFESIGRPLPNRTNIVLTRNTSRSADWVQVMNNFHDALKKYEDSEEELIVIGGQQIYELFFPYTTKLYITQIKREVEGDTYYPQYLEKFEESKREMHDEYDFVEYEKKKIKWPGVGIWIWIIKDGKILLGKRLSDHNPWVRSRPWGKLDAWESREECARRETYEETWLRIKNIQYLQTTNRIFEKEKEHFINIWMKSEYESWELTLMEPDKFETRKWFDLDNLPEPIRSWVPEVVEKYFLS